MGRESLLIEEIGVLEDRLQGLDVLIDDGEGFNGYSLDELKEIRLNVVMAISLLTKADK